MKIAFFDIKLSPSGTDSADAPPYASLVAAIQCYISVENCFYALIFWTKNSPLLEGFKDYVNARHGDLPRPFIILTLDKYEFTGTNPKNLSTTLFQRLNDSPIKLLFDFEEQVLVSAAKTVKQIFEIIPKDEKWGQTEEFNVAFEQIFSKLATCTLGFAHAKTAPDKAIY